MHDKTINCVRKAEALIEASSEDELRYACLQLRMGIEHLFYELIPVYDEEVPTDIVEKWQPKQIIDALIDCDPDIQEDATITMFGLNDDGSVGQPFMQRQQKAVTKRILRNYYHKLGSLLHAPMLDDAVDFAASQSFLRDTVCMLKEYSAKTIVGNVREAVVFDCVCGRKITRNVEALKVKPRVTCPDVNCRAMFDYAENAGSYKFTFVETEFSCPACKTINFFGTHLIADGLKLICDNCESRLRLRNGFFIEQIKQ